MKQNVNTFYIRDLNLKNSLVIFRSRGKFGVIKCLNTNNSACIISLSRPRLPKRWHIKAGLEQDTQLGKGIIF